MQAFKPFGGLPVCSDLSRLSADIALIGVPHATPYAGKPSHSALAPSAIRTAMERHADRSTHYDFDLGGTLLGQTEANVVDCGDLPLNPDNAATNRHTITQAVETILGAGAVPLILGGDDSVPIPFFAAYQKFQNITLVQIDAHIDWRHEIQGEPLGYSSTMRRASEMPWITKIIQAGMRGVGTARPSDVADAQAHGVTFVTAREIIHSGVQAAINHIPLQHPCLVTLDCDGLDPSIMPAVMAPTPGGLSYWQIIDLLQGIAAKAPLVGFDLVELAPKYDLNGLGALTAARIICNVIGMLARQKVSGFC